MSVPSERALARLLLPPLVGLTPALLLSAAALAYNRFQLEDDAMSIMWTRTPINQFSVFFSSGAAGRFMPFYWLSHWLTFRLLPEPPGRSPFSRSAICSPPLRWSTL